MSFRRFARKAVPLGAGACFFAGGLSLGAFQSSEEGRSMLTPWVIWSSSCRDEANKKRISFINNFLAVAHCATTMPAPGAGRRESIDSDFFEKEVYPALYANLPQEYDDLGQIARGEEHITVQEHVFAQMGIITFSGIKKMIKEFDIKDGDVFCDLGSGTGNVSMQVLADSTCKTVTGVEIIPSRNEFAEAAFTAGRDKFPELFTKDTAAAFHLGDVATCSTFLNEQKVSVLFTHSWMFDDDLMVKLTRELEKVPSLRAVITSRALTDVDAAKTKLEFCCKTSFPADWNEESPFYVYTKKV